VSGVESRPLPGLEGSAGDRLGMVIRAFAAGPLGAGTPQLLISQAVVLGGHDQGYLSRSSDLSSGSILLRAPKTG
jgi:hypothetical protein